MKGAKLSKEGKAMTRRAAMVVAISAVLVLATGSPARAQVDSIDSVATAPDYGSGVAAGGMSDGNFNSPESDGRPGVKFFTLGAVALKHRDYAHAVDMFKVAASWAYKPAEYNLGLMYFNGEGVAVDRALGAAWMILAAERGDPAYARTRDQMVTLLTDAQFEQTDRLWNTLKQTYGDKVALRRAKAQWVLAKSQKTGSRVGGAAGELLVGVSDRPASRNRSGHTGRGQMFTSGWGFMPDGSTDGSVAYRQFQQSDNPYSPQFIKNLNGAVTVEPLQPVKPKDVRKSGKGASPLTPANPPHSV